MMRRIANIALLAALTTGTACHTVAGAGRDLSSAGNAVTNTADKAK